MSLTKEQIEQLESESKMGYHANQVMSNPAFKQAMLLRKSQIFDVFCKSKAEQCEVREEAWRTMVNLLALEKFFQQTIDTAKMSDKQLAQNDKRKQ